MLFYLKKFISMFLMPLPIGVLLLLLGLFFLYRNKILKAKTALIASFLWLFLFSYPPVADTLLHKIESTYPALHETPKDTRYIYVLGGGHTTDDRQPITSQVNTHSVVRLTEGIRHYQQLEGKAKLIVSGYSGLYDETSHAKMQERLARSLGIPSKDIIVISKPRDTQEEAQAAKRLIGKTPFVLVTSASHMKRSMHWFELEGLHPAPAPTNHLASVENLTYFSIFSSEALKKSRIVFHETLGMIWQKIKGR